MLGFHAPKLTAATLLALCSAALPATALPSPTRPQLNAPGIVTHGARHSKLVALTFDADMTAGMEGELRSGAVKTFDNEAVVSVLQATHTPATFFLTGMWAQVYPASARALAKNPLFEIEDHTYDHPGFSQPCYGLAPIAEAAKSADLQRAQRAIRLATGVTPHLLRFPGGCAAASDVQLARSQGLNVVHWDVVGGDVNQTDPQRIVRQTLDRVQGGSIIVLHVSGGHAPDTALALPQIIAGLKARGLTPVTLNTLLETKN